MRRLHTIFLLAAVALAPAALPAAAGAAEVAIEVDPSPVRYGDAHQISGTLTSDGVAPLGGQEVVLEARPHPYRRGFREVARAVTAADGTYAFEPELDRNHEVRVAAPAAGARSAVVRALTFPRTRLSFRQVRPGVLRMTQTYRVPRDLRLAGTTRFYLASARAKTARGLTDVRIRRRRAGRFAASATARLPAAYRGRFRFAACFELPAGSGMGDPSDECPRRHRFRR